jgi:hypothetical protein
VCSGLKKLDNHSTNTYRCYDLVTIRVLISHNVVFDKAATWSWGDTDTASQDNGEPFTMEYDVEIVRDLILGSSSPPPSAPPVGEHAAPVALQPEINKEDLDVEHGDTPLRLCVANDVVGDVAPPGLVRRVLNAELNFTAADEPSSFCKAKQEESWRLAMIEEMKAIDDNETWELTTHPAGHCAIGLKWVYKVKRDEVGNVVGHKACLVAKGYVQRVGVDLDKVFAPVARLESMRMMLALAAHEH